MKWATTILSFCTASLLALGLTMLYSARMMQDGGHYLLLQLIWSGLGLVAAGVAAVVDYRLLKKFAWFLLALAVVLLALVLVPGIGLRIGGARRWLGYGGFRLQPSEFAKLALVVCLAFYGERYQRHMPTWWRGMVYPGVILAVVMGLVFREPDYGTTILFGAVGGTMLLVAGVRWRYFIPPVLAGLAAFALAVAYNPVRIKRIFSWLNLEETKDDKGYQAYQAMLALGSGGWNGLGLGNGRQKLGFVPEHHTDFIFSIIGEELGLIATLLIVLAFVVFVLCGIYIAWNARDRFGFLLGSGLTFLVGYQAFVNIGVVTSALPNKGMPLPFISYGGSNLFVLLTAVGILLNIARKGSEAALRPSLGTSRAQPKFS